MKVMGLVFLLDDLMGYCQVKNLTLKTMSSYEQSLKLFLLYLQKEGG